MQGLNTRNVTYIFKRPIRLSKIADFDVRLGDDDHG